MMVYKDMTFCEFKECKKFSTCHRALTDTVRGKAIKSGMLVSWYGSKPECYEEKINVSSNGNN